MSADPTPPPSAPPRARDDEEEETCPVCGSTALVEIRCKTICRNCRTIVRSCADL